MFLYQSANNLYARRINVLDSQTRVQGRTHQSRGIQYLVQTQGLQTQWGFHSENGTGFERVAYPSIRQFSLPRNDRSSRQQEEIFQSCEQMRNDVANAFLREFFFGKSFIGNKTENACVSLHHDFDLIYYVNYFQKQFLLIAITVTTLILCASFSILNKNRFKEKKLY